MHTYSLIDFHKAGSSRVVCQVHLPSSFPLSSFLAFSEFKQR